jgi:hypothetical protein
MPLRAFLLAAMLVPALVSTGRAQEIAHDATNAAPAKVQPPPTPSLVEKATSDEAVGKLDEALSEVNRVLTLDPKNTEALDLRGSIYVDRKLWDLAERDYTTLNQLSPDPAYAYKLAQIKFLQKLYDDARPMFAALKDDPRLGDLARYKVFICDMYGGHEAIAAKDLALLDQTGTRPSYYYGRALWLGGHGQGTAAGHYLAMASGKFSETLRGFYIESYMRARPFTPLVATFTTKDGKKFEQARVFLEEDGLRAMADDGWITLPLDRLPDDLSGFPEELRDEIEARRRSAVVTPSEASAPVSFTTRSGKKYSDVRWSLEFTGVGVLTDRGWICEPFSELPDDLSPFPAAMRTKIQAARDEAATSPAGPTTVSFTTRKGKTYDGVRAWLGDDGVDVLTADGVATVAFSDLPDDLSAFPAAWRPVITSRLKSSTGDATQMATVSFTTVKGKAYTNARAALGGDSVMILSSDGWVAVPFADLPVDLSPFPASWQPLIATWLKSNPGDTSGIQVVSFTTRRGRHYDQVRATLDDKGLAVLGPEGWVEVSFDQVPGDLSPFPAAWRETIAAGQKAAGAATGTAPNN